MEDDVRIVLIIMAFMLNMLCSEASEINFNNINAVDAREFQPIEEEGENGKEYITFNVGDQTIKFPKDGQQPDIKDAVEWSCAKISDEQITNWYLKMFGIIDRDGTPSTDDARYIKACEKNGTIKKIINVVNAHDYIINTMKTIASKAVGRLLLYRILLTVRAKPVDPLSIDSGNEFKFVHEENKVEYCATMLPDCLYILDRFAVPVRDQMTADIALFHELCHWFHYILHEKLVIGARQQIASKRVFSSNYARICQNYWDSSDQLSRSIAWSDDECAKFIKVEEIYTIAGAYNRDGDNNGDELCENLYRAEIGKHLRYGHISIRREGNTSIANQVIGVILNNGYYIRLSDSEINMAWVYHALCKLGINIAPPPTEFYDALIARNNLHIYGQVGNQLAAKKGSGCALL